MSEWPQRPLPVGSTSGLNVANRQSNTEEAELKDENAYEAIKYFRDVWAFLLEDAAESFTQYLYVDKFLFELNPTATGNGIFMLIFALLTFLRFGKYVASYFSKFDSMSHRILLISMILTIFFIFCTHALRKAYFKFGIKPNKPD